MQRPDFKSQQSVRHKVALSNARFDVTTLPADLQRVYEQLKYKHGEDYALVFVFTVRTGVELHRAWHMTMLTTKILQQIKDKFKMHMTWDLGVIKLKFRVSDGGYELHRTVPYDYDSEFQDLYMKIAVALVEDRINIHQALIFQSETKKGLHTAASGWFLRSHPGRLVLYPLEAATCAVIFFGGDLMDGAVAALCGIAAGLIEYALVTIGGDAKVLIDVAVGTAAGIIGSLFYRFNGENTCLSAVFLGTLYWFFYGTAFVIGILEIVSGSLETGVIRFMAVSVKTFILTLGATFGMSIVLMDTDAAWRDEEDNCNNIDLDDMWWRIPLYLLCSASALGQYRFPIADYWRGLIVQLVGYEIQFQSLMYFRKKIDSNGTTQQTNLDTALANVLAAAGSVVAACMLSYIVDKLAFYYNARLLQRDHEEFSLFGEFMFNLGAGYVRVTNCVGLGRRSDLTFLQMSEKLRKEANELNNPNHARTEIKLTPQEEGVLTEAIIGAEDINIWALLMPTVYQLVPGSLIAKLWFNSVFPVPLLQTETVIANSTKLEIEDSEGLKYFSASLDETSAVFADLLVTATTLALGLLVGLAIVTTFTFFIGVITCGNANITDSVRETYARRKTRFGIMGSNPEDDPDDDTGNTDYSVVDDGPPKTDAPTPRFQSITETQEDMDVSIPNDNGLKTVGFEESI